MAAAAAVIAIVGAAGSMIEGEVGARARVQQLKEAQRQQTLLAEQQTGQRLNQIKDVLETQTEQAAAKGISTSSPSFTAIQQDSVNNYSTAEKLSNIESNGRIAGLQSQIDATEIQSGISLLSGTAQTGGDAAGFITTQNELNAPTTSTQQVSNASKEGVAPPSPYQQHINQQQFGTSSGESVDESFGEENFSRIGLFGESE